MWIRRTFLCINKENEYTEKLASFDCLWWKIMKVNPEYKADKRFQMWDRRLFSSVKSGC